jgi:hypothetical protein
MRAHGLTLTLTQPNGRKGATTISKNREHIIHGLHMHTHNGVTGPLIAIKLSSIAMHRIYGHLMMVCVNLIRCTNIAEGTSKPSALNASTRRDLDHYNRYEHCTHEVQRRVATGQEAHVLGGLPGRPATAVLADVAVSALHVGLQPSSQQ